MKMHATKYGSQQTWQPMLWGDLLIINVVISIIEVCQPSRVFNDTESVLKSQLD